MSTRTIGVLVLAHGSPDDLDDMAEYLTRVRRGRAPSAAMVTEFQERYAAVPGGHSPLTERTREQADALAAELAARDDGCNYVVEVGMRFWKPFLSEAATALLAHELDAIVALPMAPQFAKLSVGAYERETREAVEAAGGGDALIVLAGGWHTDPEVVGAFADCYASLGVGGVPVIYTAHSLPERVLAEGDPYPRQVNETAAAVAEAAGVEDWQFAYQSAGATDEEWLGPDVFEAVESVAAAGGREVVVHPIGFVCDHVEILWDLDIDLAARAEPLGVTIHRVPSLNAYPRFISALADVVVHTVETLT